MSRYYAQNIHNSLHAHPKIIRVRLHNLTIEFFKSHLRTYQATKAWYWQYGAEKNVAKSNFINTTFLLITLHPLQLRFTLTSTPVLSSAASLQLLFCYFPIASSRVLASYFEKPSWSAPRGYFYVLIIRFSLLLFLTSILNYLVTKCLIVIECVIDLLSYLCCYYIT